MAETPYTPGGSYTPPVPQKPKASPPVVPTPDWSWPPNGTPAANVPTPTVPNYQAPGSYLSGVNGGLMGNLPAPAYGNGGYPTNTATAPTGGGGGGGGDTYNGWPIVDRSPGGKVLVLENGVQCNGAQYRSLSEVARAITGTQWSGPLFFGLKKKRASS